MKRYQFWNFFLTNLTKVKKFKKVPVRGITAKEVLTLWKEGKLYVEDNNAVSEEVLLTMCQHEAMEYVSTIHDFVAPECLPYIKDVWQAIVSDEAFANSLVMRKGRTQGHLNRYIMTNIVEFMRSLGFYHCESLLVLHKKMERVDMKTSIYKSAGIYSLNKKQRQRLRELKSFFAGLT